MKTMRRSFLIAFVVASLSLFLVVSDSSAEISYIGEVCIDLTSLYRDSPYYVPAKTAQLGILSYGAGYFSLNGKITDANSRVMPAVGTALLNADNAVLTLTAALGIYSETYSITVDLKTLSGSFSSIVHETFFSGPPPTPDQVISRYDKGDAVLQGCSK